MTSKRIFIVIFALILLFVSSGCDNSKGKTDSGKETSASEPSKQQGTPQDDSSLSDTSSAEDDITSVQSAADISQNNGASSEIDYDSLLESILAGANKSEYTTQEVAKGQYSIVSGISARLNSSRITQKDAKNCGKINSEKVIIFDYDDDWSFNHAPMITYFKDTFYVYWMQGRANEDDLGQRIMISTSKDFKNWTEAVPLSDTTLGVIYPDIETVQQPSGWFNNGKTLMPYYAVREYEKSSLRNNFTLRPLEYNWANVDSFIKTLDSSGNWNDAEKAPLGGGNHSAFKLKSGRWVFPSSVGIKYSDDDSGLGIWYASNLTQAQINDANNRGAVQLCEADAYETDDGILHLLMRSDTQYLWHTQSNDGGETWSDAYPTGIPNDKSKFDVGRLPDGRFYIVNNSVYGSQRNPLTIAVSSDGYNFNKAYIIRDEQYSIQKSGLDKGGIYGYPTCTVVGDYFYTVYSKGKELIEITRFKLSDLK